MRKYLWLILCLALLLSACAKKEAAPNAVVTEPTGPVQQELTTQQRLDAIRQTELQLTASALATESQYSVLCTASPGNAYKTVVTDLDGDGKNELIGTLHALIFDPDDRGHIASTYNQAGVSYFLDKDGNLYEKSGYAVFLTQVETGLPGEYQGSTEVYNCRGNGSSFELTNCVNPENETDLYQKATVSGREVPWAEGQKQLEALQLQPVTTTPEDFTVSTYDVVYTDSLIAGLDEYFTSRYPHYQGMFTGDVDGDGLEETGFLLPGFMDDWLKPYFTNDSGYDGLNSWLVTSQFNYHEERTGFLLVDPSDTQVSVTAVCALGDLRSSDKALTYNNHILSCGTARCYLPKPGQELLTYADGLTLFMEGDGYHDSFFKQADLSDMVGTEMVCMSQLTRSNNDWHTLIFAMRDGLPVPFYWNSFRNNSCFISTYEEKPALLTYSQAFRNYDDYWTNYSFQLVRFDENGAPQELDAQHISYTKAQEDGTEVAAFFAKLQPYLEKLTVLYDPFRISGNQWISPEQADAGQPPQEEKTETQEPTLGFVQVESEESWLHLRTGPGVNYTKVLTNPEDPDSFVRQALGSPVTILETIETNDEENPVWVKIRILYQDTEIIGYSSKTYIRIPE
jgi:hypothetical protein